MAGIVRAFLFGPSHAEEEAHRASVERTLPDLPDPLVAESAYRHSGSRQASFAFAQGAVVGALGNLLASSIGHFVDDAGHSGARDAIWGVLGVVSLAIIASTTMGALRRFRFNTQVEDLFVHELQRRGDPGAALAEDDERTSP